MSLSHSLCFAKKLNPKGVTFPYIYGLARTCIRGLVKEEGGSKPFTNLLLTISVRLYDSATITNPNKTNRIAGTTYPTRGEAIEALMKLWADADCWEWLGGRRGQEFWGGRS